MKTNLRCIKYKILEYTQSSSLWFKLGCVCIAAPFLASCMGTDLPVAVPQCDPTIYSELVRGNTQFASNLYQQLSPVANASGFVYSPYSISNALAMSFAGAGSETARQMAQVLGFNLDPQTLPRAFALLNYQLLADGQANGNQLNISNALFVQNGFSLESDFTATLQNDYASPVQQVDFQNNSSEAINTINSWISDRTQGLIPQLVDHQSITPSTVFALVNAIYFKGNWSSPFDTGRTSPATFYIDSSSSIQTPMMNQDEVFPAMQTDAFTLVELPYSGDKMAMDVFLPNQIDGLPSLTNSLSESSYANWISQLIPYYVFLSFPKFKTTSNFKLLRPLQDLGMQLPFTPGADFSGIDGSHDLSISNIIQQATITVDETGTVAAAATVEVGTAGMSAPPNPIVINVNHPFLFVIRDLSTNSILFMGQINEPAVP